MSHFAPDAPSSTEANVNRWLAAIKYWDAQLARTDLSESTRTKIGRNRARFAFKVHRVTGKNV